MQNTTKKQSRSKNFTQVHNDLWTDTRLSGDARCVLGYLLSKPDDWVIREMDIRKQFASPGKELASNHFFRKVIKNLQETGYIKKISHRNELGHIERWETLISDEPIFKQLEPVVENPTCGNYPVVENPTCGNYPVVENPTCGVVTPLSNKESIKNKETTTTPDTPISETFNPEVTAIREIIKAWALIAYGSDQLPNMDQGKFNREYKLPALAMANRCKNDHELAVNLIKESRNKMIARNFTPKNLEIMQPAFMAAYDGMNAPPAQTGTQPKQQYQNPAYQFEADENGYF